MPDTRDTTGATTSVPSPSTAADEDGSLVAEYGLLAVLGATVMAVAIAWARGGAIVSLLDGVLQHVRAVAGL